MEATNYKNTAHAVCSMFGHVPSETRADGKSINRVARSAPFKGKILLDVETRDIDDSANGMFSKVILFPDRSFIAFPWEKSESGMDANFLPSQPETREVYSEKAGETVETAYYSELTDPRVTGQNTNSAILYEGPSMIDGEPIVVIATGLDTDSKNTKTGAMVQTWILRQNVAPAAATQSGEDFSICGSCPHAMKTYEDGKRARTCYVNMRTPTSIWNAYKAGSYAHAGFRVAQYILENEFRMGSYGDPMAVPVGIWSRYIPYKTTDRTGYTHQWEGAHLVTNATGAFNRESMQTLAWFKIHLMASVDSVEQMKTAQAQGWRTFLVLPESTPETILRSAFNLREASKTSIQCPADTSIPKEKRVSCEDCGACHGNPVAGRKRSIYITAHGPTKKRVGLHIL